LDLRALVIDDSPVMRQFICRSLSLSGLAFTQCAEASDGKEALELLRSRTVDVILCDVNMPHMDGEQLLEHIEQDPQLRSIPILVVSADATAPRVQRMLGLGAQGYLLKPFSPELLRSELRRVLPQA
jgi:two-component system chemotaxis response regulator CheY